MRGPGSCHCAWPAQTWLQTLIALTIENELWSGCRPVWRTVSCGEWPSAKAGSAHLQVGDASAQQWNSYLWRGWGVALRSRSVGPLLSCPTEEGNATLASSWGSFCPLSLLGSPLKKRTRDEKFAKRTNSGTWDVYRKSRGSRLCFPGSRCSPCSACKHSQAAAAQHGPLTAGGDWLCRGLSAWGRGKAWLQVEKINGLRWRVVC